MIDVGDYIILDCGAFKGKYRVIESETNIWCTTAAQQFYLQKLSLKDILILDVKRFFSRFMFTRIIKNKMEVNQ